MYKKVVGDYKNIENARRAVNDLLAKGFPNDSISLIASRESADILRDAGVKIEMDFDFVEGLPDERLWQRIKRFFGFGDGKENEINVAKYAQSIRANHVLVLIDRSLVPPRLIAAFDAMNDGTAQPRACGCDEHDKNESVRLEEERMHIDKKAVETGEAVIRKRVVTETETVEVPVKHEEVVIERVPVGSQPDVNPDFEDETITIPVMEEQVEVTKRPVVTEEIKIHKRDIEETQSVSADLKREELDIEKSGRATIRETKEHKAVR